MGKEIEKKFLLKEGASIPIPSKFEKLNIKQGYICAEKGKQVRIRLYTKKAVLCVKFTGGLVRDEFEYEIPMSEAKQIYSKCLWTLEKKRLSFKRGKEQYDVDTYPNGISFVEVEFKSLENLEKWEKPSWLGEEITDNKEYSNIVLAQQNLKFK
jgi:CYTH domain-containing protein